VAEHRGSTRYEASYQGVLDAIAHVSAGQRATPGVCGDWSLKDLLGHLAFWDGDLAAELEAKQQGITLPTSSERDWQVINTEQAANRAGWDWDEVMREVRENHDRLVPLLNDPGENPNDEPIHEHWDEHHAQIESWLARNGHTTDDLSPGRSRDLYEELRQSALQTALGVPETVRDEPGVCGRWSLKELMGHLAFWDGRVADRLEARKANRAWQSDVRSYDVINAEAAAGRSTCTWDEIRAELSETHARLLPLLTNPGEEGDYRIYMHWREHGAQIEAWAAQHSHV
jgi:DinB family protein/mycothiol maleylpyruvate isomerase-like protein